MAVPSDAGISDIDIQNWLDDDLNAEILRFFVYGFYNGLFGISIWQLLAVKKISKARIYMGCIITALYIFSLIFVIATWIADRNAYVLPTSSRGRYDLAGDPSLLLGIMATTMSGLNLMIADCTIIWRCWVVWTYDWRIIILPIFFVVGEIVCGLIGIVSEFVTAPDSDYTQTQINLGLAIMATTLGTNILCTALIVVRVIYVTRIQRGIMGGIRTYYGVIEILVEWAALYSIIYVILMILYPLDGNEFMYPEVLSYPITCIAPTLIVLRVASGQGRPEESSLETQSSLRFQASQGSTIETAMDEGDEDTMQETTGGTARVLSGSFEQV